MRLTLYTALLWTTLTSQCLATDADDILAKVKILPCKDNQTVDQILDQTIRSRAQRDLGWRRFQETNYVDVERAVMITKGMEFRYRWRATADGTISPQNERTEKLCGEPS